MILHIDLNSFFARAEQQANPQLRNRPIGVLGKGHKGARTCVVAASPEAKKPWGVKSGMSVKEARRLCPNLILVPPNYARYLDISRRFIDILDRFSPWVEIFSIDEAFVALKRNKTQASISNTKPNFNSQIKTSKFIHYSEFDFCHFEEDLPEALGVAYAIKRLLAQELGDFITCSIGIAWGKVFAKLASELQKPDGLVVLKQTDWLKQVGKLPVSELCGIGQRLSISLKLLGIRTIADLAAADAGLLASRFGPSLGMRLYEIGQGIDRSVVAPHRNLAAPQSIGHQLTLDRITPWATLWPIIVRLATKVGRRLRRARLRTRTIYLHAALIGNNTWSDYIRLGLAHTDQAILAATKQIVDKFPFSPRLGVIRIGVIASDLSSDYTPQPLPLFPNQICEAAATHVIDELRDRFGEATINWASASRFEINNLRDWRGPRAVLDI